MKLKEFNKTNTQVYRTGKCQVSVNGNTGVICFTKESIQALKIEDYDFMKFMHDEESGDWYIMPTKATDGFPLRKKNPTMVYTNSVTVAKQINEGISKKSASYLVSQNPEKHGGYNIYLIIKSSAIVRDEPPPKTQK